jgi:hypothetical protein
LDISVLEEELLVVFKIFKCSLTFNKCSKKCGLSEKKDGNCHDLTNSRWEMLLKAIEQPLGTATVKECRKAAGKCPKAIGKPLGNS